MNQTPVTEWGVAWHLDRDTEHPVEPVLTYGEAKSLITRWGDPDLDKIVTREVIYGEWKDSA